jgi:hypothetical protein
MNKVFFDRKKDEINIYLPLTKAIGIYQQAQLSFYYDKGGYNYFHGGERQRAFNVAVKICNHDGYILGYDMMTGGLRSVIKEVPRFNKKEIDNQLPEFQFLHTENMDRLVQKVILNKGSLFAEELDFSGVPDDVRGGLEKSVTTFIKNQNEKTLLGV